MTSHPEFIAVLHKLFILMKTATALDIHCSHSTPFMPYRVDLLLCHPTIQENRLGLLLSISTVSFASSLQKHNESGMA